MKYELSHDTIARQIYDKSSVEAKARRKIKLLVERAFERHLNNPKILLSKEDLEEVKPFEGAIFWSEEEQHFINRSRWAIHRQRNLLIGLTVLVVVALATLSIWALREKSRVEKARQKVEIEKTRATSVLLASKAREAQHNQDDTRALRLAHYSANTDLNQESRDILFEQFYQPDRYYYRLQKPLPGSMQSLRQVATDDRFPATYFFLNSQGSLFAADETVSSFRPVAPNLTNISSMSLIPGQKVMILSHEDRLSVVDYEDAKVLKGFRLPNRINKTLITKDGQHLVTTFDGSNQQATRQVLVWNIKNNDISIADTLLHTFPVINVALSGNGQFIVTETSSNFYLWTSDGENLAKVRKDISLETDIFFYPKPNAEGCWYLIKTPSAYKTNSLRIYEGCGDQLVDRTRALQWTLPEDNLGIMSVGDNGMLAFTASQSPIYCYKPYFDEDYKLQLGQPFARLNRKEIMFDEKLIFHHSEGHLISVGKKVTIWSLASQYRPYQAFLPEYQQAQVSHGLCNLYPNWWTYTLNEGSTLTGTFRMFNGPEADPVFTKTFTGKAPPKMDVNAKGDMVFFDENTDQILLYDSSQQLIFQQEFTAHSTDFLTLAPNGQHLMLGSQKSNDLTIFNRNGRISWKRQLPNSLSNAVFHPTHSDTILIAVSNDKNVMLLQVNTTYDQVDSLMTQSYLDRHLAISPDGSRILLVGSNQIELLDSTLKVGFSLNSEDATFSMARLSPNGEYLVVIDSEDAKVYDIKYALDPLITLHGANDAVLSREDNQILVLAPTNSSSKISPVHQLQIWPFGVKAILEEIEQMQIADLPEDILSLYNLK